MDKPIQQTPMSISICKGQIPEEDLEEIIKAIPPHLLDCGVPTFHVKPSALEMESPVEKKQILGGQRRARRRK